MNNKDLLDFEDKLDRAFFIDNENKEYAYRDSPLAIGYGQTISQPSLVLEMTLLLALDKDKKVLEIGTGSGYQTAILAEFSGSVYTVERIRELAEKAKVRLDQLGYTNILFKIGDGSEGWQENAPYDRIIVTAAAEQIPSELVAQLAVGGKMVIPVGSCGLQELMLVTKESVGILDIQTIGKVVFVEMKGKYGWSDTK